MFEGRRGRGAREGRWSPLTGNGGGHSLVGLMVIHRIFWRCAVFVLAGVACGAAAFAGRSLEWGDGVNLQPSYFAEGNVTFGWELMRQHPAIRTVRVEIEPRVPMEVATRWLREAHAEGLRVIATYHHFPYNGSDSAEELLNAARWWKKNFATLNEAAPGLIVNLMNEWGSHKQTARTFADAYNPAISVVREVYQGPIIVDVPGWGQETYVARDASALLPDGNLIFSVHIYASGWVEQGPNRWMRPEDLDALDATGRPAIVGEFGGEREGESDWSAIIDHAREKGWPLLAWAWNGDGERMNMVQPYWGDEPRAQTYSPHPYFQKVYSKLREVRSPGE